ncbi:hypothetical protein J6590_072507 [Homalodisca vitripennis]|nr:hypothetical protein J6590_072507 [Homalodisca vitripennis]
MEGDSYTCHLAGLVQQRVDFLTRVSDTCRPGAKLPTVSAGSPPLPGGCSVLFAGTNDVAAGETCSILEHLERQITARLRSSGVIVLTLPRRHNLTISLRTCHEPANCCEGIEELCIQYEGIELLEFNSIGKRWFTNHGIRLRLPDKRLLADLVVGGLSRWARSSAVRPPSLHQTVPVASACEHPSSPSVSCTMQRTSPQSLAQPRTLSHDSFTEAIKSDGKA